MNCAHAFFFAEASFAFVSGLRAHSSNLDIFIRGIFVQYKMVVITIVTEKNGETIFFDEPIPQVHFMKLISCSLYNSWDNLKKEATFSILQADKGLSVSKLPPGHYTAQTIAEGLKGVLERYDYDLGAEIYTPFDQIAIINKGKRPLRLDRDLSDFLDTSREIKSFKTYFGKEKRVGTIHKTVFQRGQR